MIEQFAISITADGVVGTPEPDLKLASDCDLKDGDLVEVRSRVFKLSSTQPEYSTGIKLAQFNCYRYGDSGLPVTEDCTPRCCTYVSFLGTDVTADSDEVLVVRKVKLVDAE